MSAPWAGGLRRGVTVLGNLAVDRIDGGPPTPGGCPSFAGPVLAAAEAGAHRVVARAAPADLPLFADVVEGSGVPVDLLPALRTSGFGLHYDGDDRAMTVDAVGPVWAAAEIDAAAVTTTWAHVAPLLRSDFTPAAIARLAAGGTCVALDGQGLVRVPQAGPLRVDGAFDPAVLAALQVLKLADDEAAVLTGGAPLGPADAARLGVPELLVTHGSRGCDLFAAGDHHHVPPAWAVRGVHTTGAGDTFTLAYVAARAAGDGPLPAARAASRLVAELLQVRLEGGWGGPPG